MTPSAAAIRDAAVAPAVALAVVLAVAVRTATMLVDGLPVGVDPGNWLGLGGALAGSSSVYPPVVPLLTRATVALWDLPGIAVLAGVSAVAPAAVVLWLLRRWEVPSGVVLVALVLLCAPAWASMAAWGGYPQLLGTAIALLWLATADSWLRSGRAVHAVGAAAASALLAATSHAGLGLAAAAGAVLVVVHLRGGQPARDVLLRASALLLGAVLGLLPLLGTYTILAAELWGSLDSTSALTRLPVWQLPGAAAGIHGVAIGVWAAVVTGALLGARGHRPAANPAWRMGVSVLLGGAAIAVLTGEPRALYDLPCGAVLLAAGAVCTAPSTTGALPRRAAAALGVALVLAAGVDGVAPDRARYGVLDQDLVAALGYIQAAHPTAELAVGPSGDSPLGWWVQGLTGRRVLYAAPTRWLLFADERESAARANHIFHVLRPTSSSGLDALRAEGIDLVLLTGAAAGRARSGAVDLLYSRPDAVVFATAPTAHVRTDQP